MSQLPERLTWYAVGTEDARIETEGGPTLGGIYSGGESDLLPHSLAAELARRWNAHAAMVDALEALLDTMDEPNEDIREVARSALAAAKGTP